VTTPWFQRPIDVHAVADAYLRWLQAALPVPYHHNPIDGPDAVRPRR